MTAPTSDDTRDRAHPATDVMREAEALLALVLRQPINEQALWWILRHNDKHGVIPEENEGEGFVPTRDDAKSLSLLYNRAPTVIRALMERVKGLEETVDACRTEFIRTEKRLKARIAALEADNTYLDAQCNLLREKLPPDIWPMAAEIAARVEQKRKSLPSSAEHAHGAYLSRGDGHRG